MIPRLIQAVTELIEAHSERIREETSTLALGIYGRAYKEGREDALDEYGIEVVYTTESDDDDTE